MKYISTYIALAIIILATSCSKDKETDKTTSSTTTTSTVTSIKPTITFSHKVGNEALIFDSIKYTNAAGNKYSVITLKYFISDIIFHGSNDNDIKLDTILYIDAVNSNTLSFSSNRSIENGSYDAVSFTFGLDSAKNITGSLTGTNEAKMEWPTTMGGGYHFMKLEGKYDTVNTTKNFNVHIGTTMKTSYHFDVTLPSSAFTANSKNTTFNIAMDINQWFGSVTNYDFNDYDNGTMMDMKAQKALKENCTNLFSVDISLEE